MKKLLLLLTLSINVQAVEFGASYIRINQDLFGSISFPMDALGVDATYWHSTGFGLRGSIAFSTMTANQLYVDGFEYENKIDHLYSFKAMYRHKFDDLGVELGVGQTDYKTSWLVNGEVPTWSGGSDSDASYYVGLTYNLNERVDLRLGYEQYYNKVKKRYGRETTEGYNLSLVYRW